MQNLQPREVIQENSAVEKSSLKILATHGRFNSLVTVQGTRLSC